MYRSQISDRNTNKPEIFPAHVYLLSEIYSWKLHLVYFETGAKSLLIERILAPNCALSLWRGSSPRRFNVIESDTKNVCLCVSSICDRDWFDSEKQPLAMDQRLLFVTYYAVSCHIIWLMRDLLDDGSGSFAVMLFEIPLLNFRSDPRSFRCFLILLMPNINWLQSYSNCFVYFIFADCEIA